MKTKVLITTSGLGQRLGNLTKYTNKALVRVGKKPAISYIIESYPKDARFVVTIGYFGDQIQDFLKLAYPDRHFEFVAIDRYEGLGTSLGYSMLQAKELLQCPFVFHAADTIVTSSIPKPTKNWIGVFRGDDSSQYASWKVTGQKNLVFNAKGAIDFDYLHIGLIGIKDYRQFWSALTELYRVNPNDSSLNDCAALVKMLEQKTNFELVEFPVWYDIGNVASLQYARENISDRFSNLDKFEEDIFIFKDFVIKFFANEKILANRVKRAKILTGLVPKLEGEAKNFYRYKFVRGDLYSQVANPDDFAKFLIWAKKKLWRQVTEVNNQEFKKTCLNFYSNKTKTRIKKFLEANAIKDGPNTINGILVPSVEKLLDSVNFEWLTETTQSQFHGDFILENIIKTKIGYCLIDWRQDFGGLLQAGDIYYDLAKLNHNLTVNHDIISKNLFTIKVNDDQTVACDILVKKTLSDCRQTLFKFLEQENLDPHRVEVLTALIWLNMSPLHHHPFNLFLFYFGKYNLWQALQKL